MRDLKDFSRREWRRWKPLDHFMIQICNDGLQGLFVKWKPRGYSEFLRDAGRLQGKNVGLVVAYEQPWALGWLLKMAQRHLTDGALLVFDNSRNKQVRKEIELVCRRYDTLYLPLPFNPTRHPNRSHGMAMTWIFRNVVQTLRPKMFTYIDHDLIPIVKTDLGGILAGQPFYGVLNASPWAWSLWAGFCSYDFPAVDGLSLNYLNDFSIGLDTGGRNWPHLYCRYDRSQLRFASQRDAEITVPERGISGKFTVIDDRWLHIGAVGYSDAFRKEADLFERIAKASYDGVPLQVETTK
ncbi:MAG: hypothetical protein PHY31_00845 [Smithellaceae bacterium]|nr:hypothetical protein [Smithellaceae bacterium]